MNGTLITLFSAEHLFDPNPGPPSVYYGIVGFFFAVIFGATLSTYLRYRQHPWGPPTLVKKVSRALVVGMILGGIGVILVIARFFTIPFLSMRIILYLWIITTLGLLGYAIYYVRRVYPTKKVAYQQAYARSRYMPKPAPKPGGRKKKAKRRR